ncbi:MAG: SpoVR family protein [Nanoarchaeota archaeon]
MEPINQETKKIMEGCKDRAREVGLVVPDDTLEFIVTNRDLINLMPKIMIPTLYDYWVQDIKVIRDAEKYKHFPENPYEAVINSRPAISFYNDNNPDWLNIMIFYHVLGHIDFFRNNIFFKQTEHDDFVGKALTDKQLIEQLRSEKGRWVDYVIEFSRGIDNIVGFYDTLSEEFTCSNIKAPEKVRFYFDVFLQKLKKTSYDEYLRELGRYNSIIKDTPTIIGNRAEDIFFTDVDSKYPEFQTLFKKHKEEKRKPQDLLDYLLQKSPFLNREENLWMKSVVRIVRDTSLYFQPQSRTKIMNEGWASYWHEKLFISDERIKGHLIDFSIINAYVTSPGRLGLNPYALGLRLFKHIQEMGDKGKDSYEFQLLNDINKRNNFDNKAGKGNELIFKVRENYSDQTFIAHYVDQDFMDRYQLFVAQENEFDPDRGTIPYTLKNRKAEDFKQMLFSKLPDSPIINVSEDKTDKTLYLVHDFKGKKLLKRHVPHVMRGIEFLWGAPVKLETVEVHKDDSGTVKYQKVLYTMENKEFTKEKLE